MRRSIKCGIISICILFAVTGCGSDKAGRSVKSGSNVDQVLQDEIAKSKDSEQEEEIDPALLEGFTEVEEPDYPMDGKKDESVDVDISVMGSDMVYATVYQMMTDPDSYVGQTIKITGTCNSVFYEPTGLTYHYAVISDATACCAQGIEFELSDEAEYPEEGEEITLKGTFSTYEEEGNLYCTLENSSICTSTSNIK